MFKFKFSLVLAAVILISLVGGGTTLALFSATGPTESYQYTAASLKITSNRTYDPIPGPMFYVTQEQGMVQGSSAAKNPTGLWAPGDSQMRTLDVKNYDIANGGGSTIDAWLSSVGASLQQGSDPALADKLMVVVTTSQPQPNTANGPAGDVVVASGPLSKFLAGAVPLKYPDGSRVPLYLNSEVYLHFTVNFDLSSDDTYQGNNLKVDFLVNAEQMAHNP